MEMLKEYFFSCCHILNIKVKELDGEIYELSFSEGLSKKLKVEEVTLVSFQKKEDENVLFLSNESYFLQNISKCVTELVHPFLSVKVKKRENGSNDFVYFVYKTRIQTLTFEEELHYLKYDVKNEEISEVTRKEFENYLHEKESSIKIEKKIMEKSEEKAIEKIEEITKRLIQKKKRNLKERLKKEVERIEAYYQQVKKEHENSYTHTSYEDYGIISEERENLIKSQIVKYSLDEDEVVVEPVLVLYVKEN